MKKEAKKIVLRQGDVSLHPIDALPKEAKLARDNVLALGETTGHEHRFECAEQVVYTDAAGNKYVQLLAPAKLVHDFAGQHGVTVQEQAQKEDKHLVLDVKPGVYAVQIERELDVFTDAIRQVAD